MINGHGSHNMELSWQINLSKTERKKESWNLYTNSVSGVHRKNFGGFKVMAGLVGKVMVGGGAPGTPKNFKKFARNGLENVNNALV